MTTNSGFSGSAEERRSGWLAAPFPGAVGPGLLLAAALVPDARAVAAAILLLGWVLLRASRRPEAIAWAACVPVGIVLPWPLLLGIDMPLGERGCTSLASVIAVRRFVVAAVGLTVVLVLARAHASTANALGLRAPGRREGGVAVLGALLLAAAGLWIGPTLARPFFGVLGFPTPLAALAPGMAFGLANGLLEEVTYRGAMQAWLSRIWPTSWAIAFQGLVFGIVHAGPEVLALLPLHIALLACVGIAAGVARARLGSVWIPIGVHVGADVALYVGLACRAVG